ncbi:hypothetical protein SARC_12154, partial [Sphaeroforma arctica JP610]
RMYDGEREFKLEADIRRLLATEDSARALVRDSSLARTFRRHRREQQLGCRTVDPITTIPDGGTHSRNE